MVGEDGKVLCRSSLFSEDASRLRISESNPLPTPHHIFSSASRFGERPREKMFTSSFTMSEQKHRQWTPYKHLEVGI